jgi:hypothetical protein
MTGSRDNSLSTGGFVSTRHRAETLCQLMEAVAEVFVAGEMTTIVAKVEAVGPDRFHMELTLPENAFQFRRAAAVRE